MEKQTFKRDEMIIFPFESVIPKVNASYYNLCDKSKEIECICQNFLDCSNFQPGKLITKKDLQVNSQTIPNWKFDGKICKLAR